MTTDITCSRRTEHPRRIHNPPRQTSLRARVGDFASFRRALLGPREAEIALRAWAPAVGALQEGSTDLALALVEWWAYLADVLTFYNERVLEEGYLRTTRFSAARLVSLLGYRPRPGIGAVSLVGARVTAPTAMQVPAGFALQTRPLPGAPPQIFETTEPVSLDPGGVLDVDIEQHTFVAGRTSVLVRGAIPHVSPGDALVIVGKQWPNVLSGYARRTVLSLARETDPRGAVHTRVTFTAAIPTLDIGVGGAPPPGGQNGFVPGTRVSACRLLRPAFRTQLFDAPANPANNVVVIAGPTRSLGPGDLVWVNDKLVVVESYADSFTQSAAPGAPGAPLPTGTLVVGPDVPEVVSSRNIEFGFRDVGELADEPVPRAIGATELTVRAASEGPFPVAGPFSVLVEDAASGGALARALSLPSEAPGAPRRLALSFEVPVTLTAPLRLLAGLLPVTCGKSVRAEILGSGDASRAHQSFALKQGPLTYLAATLPDAPRGVTSTLRVRVGGVLWREVPHFVGQASDAQVYVTREDEQGKTHVTFGDGVRGARLPTGANNIVADYRVGSGEQAPRPGALTTVLKPLPGVADVRSPIAGWGGEDPESPDALRRLAPRSVLTFGRAISAEDYEAIAASAPSVRKARASFAWDSDAQAAVVHVVVGDDEGAVRSARERLRLAADPNRPLRVSLAKPLSLAIAITVSVDPRHDAERVKAAIRSRLLDPDTGLFGERVNRIGVPLYNSQIFEACLGVPGAIAAVSLGLFTAEGSLLGARHAPGEGRYFHVSPASLDIQTEVSNHGFQSA